MPAAVALLPYLLFFLPGFVAFDLGGYVLHRSLHSLPWPWWRRAHSFHHHLLYPPERFLGPAPYRSVGDVWRFAIAAASFSAALFATFRWQAALPLSVELVAYSLLNEYLHDAFHVKGHPLEAQAWFRRLRALHVRHHEDVRTNFGIFSFFWDRAFRTYVPPRAL